MTTRGSARFSFAFLIVFVFLPCLFLPSRNALALEETEAEAETGDGEQAKPRVFGFDAGIQGSYATGISTSSFYYQPFADIYLKHTYVRFTAGLSRFQDYQITDGEGDFETANFTQPETGAFALSAPGDRAFRGIYYSTGDKTHITALTRGPRVFFSTSKGDAEAAATEQDPVPLQIRRPQDKTAYRVPVRDLFGLWLR